MKKLLNGWRRILRRVWQGLSISALAMVFQACYGPFLAKDDYPYGTVQNGEGAPIKDILVLLIDQADQNAADTSNWPQTSTAEDGSFQLWLPYEEAETYTARFKDVDGAANGSYQDRDEILVYGEPNTITLSAVAD
ncbi:MAG: hypothetical protein LBR16_00325 [Treponema sp.]|jgi:hypothetical protein|nr:hypothetical protein [Treponema sp.]